LKIRKKGENTEIKEILHKSPSKRSFTNGIHRLLKRADARESGDSIYLISLVCGSGIYLRQED